MAQTLIFDADAHVTEPAGVWADRMSHKKWGDLVPQVRVADGRECWFVGDKNMGLVTSSSFVRVHPETGETFRQAPSGNFFSGGGYRELHPSSYDAAVWRDMTLLTGLGGGWCAGGGPRRAGVAACRR